MQSITLTGETVDELVNKVRETAQYFGLLPQADSDVAAGEVTGDPDPAPATTKNKGGRPRKGAGLTVVPPAKAVEKTTVCTAHAVELDGGTERRPEPGENCDRCATVADQAVTTAATAPATPTTPPPAAPATPAAPAATAPATPTTPPPAAPATPAAPAAPASGIVQRPEGKRGDAYDALKALRGTPGKGVPACREILKKFDAAMLSDLKDEQLDAFITACKPAEDDGLGI